MVTEWKEQIYPASMTKIMTAIVALEAFSDLDHEITLSENSFLCSGWTGCHTGRLSGQGRA